MRRPFNYQMQLVAGLCLLSISSIGFAWQNRPRQKVPIVQVGHTGRLEHVVFHPGQPIFVTTAQYQEGTETLQSAILWDTKTGDKLRQFPPTPSRSRPVFCLRGEAVMIGGIVWEVKTGRQLAPKPIKKVSWQPELAALDSDGEQWIGVADGEVQVRDLSSGRIAHSWPLSEFRDRAGLEEIDPNIPANQRPWNVVHVGLTRTGAPLVLLRMNETRQLQVWNVAQSRRLSRIPYDIIDVAKFSPTARCVYTRHWGDTGSALVETKVYDASTGKRLSTSDEWLYDFDPPLFVDFDHFCVTGTTQNVAKLRDLQAGKLVREFSGHHEPIYSLGLSVDGKVLETRSRDRAQRWDWRTGTRLSVFSNPDLSSAPKIYSGSSTQPVIVASPDGRHFTSGHRLHVRENAEAKHAFRVPLRDRQRQPAYRYQVHRTTFDPEGQRVLVEYVTAHYDAHQSVLYDVESGEQLRQISASPVINSLVAWNRDGTRAITSFPSGYRLWDVPHGKLLRAIGYEWSPERKYMFGGYIAFTNNDRFVYIHGNTPLLLWDARTGEPWKHELPGDDEGPAASLLDAQKLGRFYSGRSAVSLNHRFAASWHNVASQRRSVQLWDLEAGSVVHTLDQDETSFTNSVFSPDGSVLAAASRMTDWQVDVWSVASGNRLYSLKPQEPGNGRQYPSIHFVADGGQMLVTSPARDLLLYETKSGKLLYRMTNPHVRKGDRRPAIRSEILVSPNQRYVAASYSSDYTIVWDLENGRLVKKIERDLGGISVEEYYQFSDDSRRLLTRFRPATIYALFEGDEDEVLQIIRELPGFTQPSRYLAFERSKAQQEALHAQHQDVPASAKIEPLSGEGRFLVHHRDGRVDVRDANSQTLYQCYIVDSGDAWLTLLPDGTAHGALQYVRFRD